MQTRPDGGRPHPTDGELAEQARAGAQRAFELLVQRYQGLAIARAFAVLNDRTEAEDVAQEAFLNAFRSLGQLRSPEAFGPWLLQAVANVARRAASKRARRAAAPLDPETPGRPGPPAGLLEALATLSEEDQQVVHLHYSQGYRCAEIAALLGLKTGSVTSRLTRARQRLREILRED